MPYASAQHLIKRRDFVRVAKMGKKAIRPSLILQFYRRKSDGPMRVGYTVSKKVGNAVVRNRVRRQLREIVRLIGFPERHKAADVVLIGRRGTLGRSFSDIMKDYESAFHWCCSSTSHHRRRRERLT